jgi:predicted O-methyltransferase YrrM
VGVFTGYSSLAVALSLPPDGRLLAFDRDAKTMAVAQRYWEAAGVADKVCDSVGRGNGSFVESARLACLWHWIGYSPALSHATCTWRTW